MLLSNNLLGAVIACHVWLCFRTPRELLGSKSVILLSLVSSLSPCLAVFILEVRVLHFHKFPCFRHHDDLQSSLRIQGPMMCPNSSMVTAKLSIVVS